ncbi:isopentenyl phosphate kinase [Nitrososphaera viennensis]|uniref:Isopentenyl phosphate kinase n=2 Tax=Nitrososphaera viennensis TaxID=1034015 RepID=A0A060HED0_9ARCH|nr:isopentenyl phosphate kinase [Nitrososphaera viennensis]AIC15024.1 putative aspartate/glutamate/uridylate kinase [Nitrososphaera viennensis EN76]UVS69955.1 isopentenyl phosphate kinase [Nitrososphaera viennensis]
MQKLVLVKLGGSVITFKDRALAANTGAIDGISGALAQLDMPVMVVHGGGSFGHHWSVQYDMHTKAAPYDPHGVAVVHESMVALNQIIVNSMIKAGANPYAVAPAMFTTGHKVIAAKVKQLHEMAKKSNVIPVTFGDVVHMGGRKYSILSGDALMSIIAKVLKPSRVIFATNVDGIYRDMQTKEIIKELKPGRGGGGDPVEFSKTAGADVTGGMQRKVREAFKIASMGMDVVLVNGLYPERIAQAAQGKVQTGTVVKKGRK